MRVPLWRATAALAVGAATIGGWPAHADADALWQLVDGQCVVAQVRDNDPGPCAAVDLAGRYAVLKDSDGERQYLLIPTDRVTGAEDPLARDPSAPNYFAEAWAARVFTEARAGGVLPADAVALTVNSAAARSQDQLHIHIDCLSGDVRDGLNRAANEIGTRWAPLPVALAGRRYDAMRVPGLGGVNPFVLAAADGYDMAAATLAVVGSRQGSGFVLLRRTVDARAPGGAEELQDHTQCPAPLPPGPYAAK